MPQSLMFIVPLITKATMIDFHEINPIWCACVYVFKKKNPSISLSLALRDNMIMASRCNSICNSRLLKFHACFLQHVPGPSTGGAGYQPLGTYFSVPPVLSYLMFCPCRFHYSRPLDLLGNDVNFANMFVFQPIMTALVIIRLSFISITKLEPL